MEARKITVVSTKNQTKNVFMSEATTLGELKADLRQHNIDYEGMTFYEGTSKTELITDSSVLPHDVPYKGQVTNELVFMLTNTNKKIRSGASMTRAEVYEAIKANNLQEACVLKYGKNFTMCKTDDLITLVNYATKDTYDDTKEVKEEHTGCVDHVAREAIEELINELECDFNMGRVRRALYGETSKKNDDSSYTDNEISSMFDFVK